MRTPNRSLACLLVASFAVVAAADEPRAQSGPRDVEASVDSLFAEWSGTGTPGAAVAVIQDGEVVLAKGYGTAHLEHGVPITPETRFHTASVSKQFTAYAVALLAAEGALSLDDEVHQYLPELHDFGTPITIRHLLHHTAGIRQDMRLQAIAGERWGELLTQEKSLEVTWAQRELNFVPGTEFTYSGSHYTLLATIVEHVTGEPFGSWMRERVFEPLGMTRTLVVDDYNMIVPDRAEPYEEADEGYERDWGLLWTLYGTTGVHSTVLDMARWLSFLQAPPPEAAGVVRQMHERGVLASGDTLDYAFGLQIAPYRDGLTRVWHGGDGDGYQAFTVRIPEAGLGVVVLTNVDELSAARTGMGVADLYLSDWFEQRGVERPDDVERPVDDVAGVVLDTLLLDALAGEYEAEPPADFYKREVFAFERDGDRLLLRPPGGGRVELQAASDTTFAAGVAPVTFTFHRAPDGAVPAVTVHFPDEDRRAQRAAPLAGASPEELQEYAGVYHSPELGTEYRFFVEEGRLLARHPSYRDFELEPTVPDAFDAEFGFFKWVRFERDEGGRITGFRVTNSNERVRNLWFERRE